MVRLDFNKLIPLTLAALSLGLIAVLAFAWLQHSRTEFLTCSRSIAFGVFVLADCFLRYCGQSASA